MAQRDKPIDATIDIVTPENISFCYRVAGPFRRLPAFVIDLLLRFGIWFAIVFVFGILGVLDVIDGALAIVFMLLLLFVMEWLYGGLLETFWNGQTVGKRVMRIRVLSTGGQPINGLQAMMRNILRFADMMPLIPFAVISDQPSAIPIPTFVIGLIAPLLNRRFQRLGDIVCGTMVVIEERGFLLDTAKLKDPRVAQLAAELPPGFNVTQTMARALTTYVDRRQFFSPPRRREISRHIAEPLIAKFGLPSDTDNDLLLCALYHCTFIVQQDDKVAMPSGFGASKEIAVDLAPGDGVHIPPDGTETDNPFGSQANR